MWIATNRFQINNSFANDFEAHWRKRESFLSEMPEFMRFRFLRAPAGDDTTEFVSYTEWFSKKGFEAWLESSQIKKAHGRSTVPREAYAGAPKFQGYEVVLDQVPGGRSDYRSTWMDLRVEKNFSSETPQQTKIKEVSAEAALPKINVGAFEGRILEILTRSVNATAAIEVGTLGGYSASWIAKGLNDGGKLYSFEMSPKNAQVARDNLSEAGLSDRVEVIEGDARSELESFFSKHDQPIDLAFIDADKASYSSYLEMIIPRLKKGGLVICDNAYLWGAMEYFQKNEQVANISKENDVHSYNPDQVKGMWECWQQLSSHPELASIVLPSGEGMAVAVKL